MLPRSLLLNGFMATGKSTVGQVAAARLGIRFVDLDVAVEQRAGVSVAQIFAEKGEGAFRALEREELDRVLDSSEPVVVALGGGALLHRAVRLRALESAVVVNLTAPLEELERRATGAPGSRPLMGNPEHVATLLELRGPAYAEAHATFDTSQCTPEAIADEIVALYRRDPVCVAAGTRSYGVDIGPECSREVASAIAGATQVVLLTDSNVGPLHAASIDALVGSTGVPVTRIEFPAGEEHKNLATLEWIWGECLAAGVDRKSVFLGLGGGVVTDVTGFAAASWMRGVRWFGIPTTLLAMVDASVGGKTAVDFSTAKNCVGAFHQPSGVFCDINLLATEPERGFVSALSEVVKTGLIGDATILSICETQGDRIRARDPEIVANLVRRCVRVKASVVNRDEREAGLRATLNLGHTVGHALEAMGGYGRLTHGEAVSLGLVAALAIGEKLGVTPKTLSERVCGILGALGLPTKLDRAELKDAAALLGQDKKRAGKNVQFVVARAPEDVALRPLALDELQRLTVAI